MSSGKKRLLGGESKWVRNVKSNTPTVIPPARETKVQITKGDSKRPVTAVERDGKEEKTTWRLGTLSQSRERQLTTEGYKRIAGVDEAGRGCLAGYLVAAACIFPLNVPIVEGINDSKKLTEKQRESLYTRLTTTKDVIFATCIMDNKEIDSIGNILKATMTCMVRALNALSTPPDYVLVDGNHLPSLPAGMNGEPVIQGDGTVYSIGAASIIAKVTRDRLMREYHKVYPGYEFDNNKGYGSAPAHIFGLEKLGPCPIHRRTFAPIKHGAKGIKAAADAVRARLARAAEKKKAKQAKSAVKPP